ncbi:MAG: DUF2939 domain-containing protein [Gammaproteobacteria bacterium]|jgi:hypothetical protein
MRSTFVIILLAVVAYALADPYITVHRMRAAVDARDGGELSEHVDFDSVRQNLKNQFDALLLEETNSSDESPLEQAGAALGALLSGFIVDSTIDLAVTPAGLEKLMRGQRLADGDDGSKSGWTTFPDARMGYSGLAKFTLSIASEDGDRINFVLRRRGLGWKLTEIDLPLTRSWWEVDRS